jgi:uncharacterized iron-regulated membrane protein
MTDLRVAAAPPKPKRRPLMSRIPAPFVRAVLKGHSSLGLVFAVAIYLVCLSGTLAVFAREFQRWENPHAPRVTAASPQAVQTALAGAVAKAGNPEHVFVYPAIPDLPWLFVMTDSGGYTFTNWVADAEGRNLAPAPTPWSDFVTALHINLHLPRFWGGMLVGMTGVALLSLLISGLLAHPRIFRDAFHLRLGGSRRLQEADLHNRMGVWAMPFHLLVSATGAFLGLTTIVVGILGFALFEGDTGKVYALFIAPEPKDDPAPAPLLDIRPMFAAVETQAPGGRINFIGLEHPGERGAAAQFSVAAASGRLANLDAYTFDRRGLYHQSKARDNNVGMSVIGSLGTLHFGWFGGGLVKIAYGLLGLAMTYLAASGVLIWLARRRDKGNAAPGWERAWIACMWGQPAALAAAALLGVAMPVIGGAALIALWLGITGISVAAAILRGPAATLSRIGRIATVALLGLAALAQLVLRGGWSGDAMGLAVNAALVAGAAVIAVSLRRRMA